MNENYNMKYSGTKPYEYIARIQELIKLLGFKNIYFKTCYPVLPRFPKGDMSFEIIVNDMQEWNRLQEFLYPKEPKPLSKWTKFVRKIKGWTK